MKTLTKQTRNHYFNVMPKAERFLNKFQSTKNIRF